MAVSKRKVQVEITFKGTATVRAGNKQHKKMIQDNLKATIDSVSATTLSQGAGSVGLIEWDINPNSVSVKAKNFVKK